jgi:hypothetical protein
MYGEQVSEFCRRGPQILCRRFVTAETVEVVKDKATRTMELNPDWLKRNGMVCNTSKTNMLLLDKDQVPLELNIDGNKIVSQSKTRDEVQMVKD